MPLASPAKTRNKATMKLASIALLASMPFVISGAPVRAQERVLQIFGQDKCPANTICITAPESERFRIPKDLRGPSQSPEAQSWAVRSQGLVATGSAAPSACTKASNQGWTGCFAEDMKRARDEARAKKEAEPVIK